MKAIHFVICTYFAVDKSPVCDRSNLAQIQESWFKHPKEPQLIRGFEYKVITSNCPHTVSSQDNILKEDIMPNTKQNF